MTNIDMSSGVIDTAAFAPPTVSIPNLPFANIGRTNNTPMLLRPAPVDALMKKYQTLGNDPTWQSLPESIRNSLIQYDSKRVSKGNNPLNDEETAKVVQTAVQRNPATPASERSLLNVPGNALRDIGTIVRSIPRLPKALYDELRAIPEMGTYVSEAEGQGKNAIAAVAGAPGVRLLPGAYLAQGLAGGASGIKDLITHPVLTALDVLPVANKLAETTAVGAKAAEVASEAGRPSRAIQAVLTKKIGDAGELTPNALGTKLTELRTETWPGQALDRAFGMTTRKVMHLRDDLRQRAQALADGLIDDGGTDTQLWRESASLMKRHPNIAVEDVPRLTRMGKLSEYDQMTPDELAFIRDAEDLAWRYGKFAVGQRELGGITDPRDGRMEYYDLGSFNAYQGKKYTAQRSAELAFARDQVLNPTLTPDDYLRALEDVANAPRFDQGKMKTSAKTEARLNGTLSIADAKTNADAARHALSKMGYDTRALAAKINKRDWAGVKQWVEDNRVSPLLATPDVQTTLSAVADNWAQTKLGKYTQARAIKAQQSMDQWLTNNAPKRFKALIDSKVEEIVGAKLTDPSLDPKYVAEVTKSVTRTWREMKDAGIDPLFVHTVPPQRIGQVLFPQVGEVPTKLSQTKKTTLDAAPGVNDIVVALTDQGREFVSRRLSEEFIDHVARGYGVRQSELYDRFIDKARRIEAESGGRLDEKGALQAAINREMKKFDPLEQGYSWGGPRIAQYADDPVWLPKALADNLRSIHNPETMLSGVFDPFTKTFRVAVIGLSPRTHLYNIVGGAIMTTAETGFGAWRYAADAWRQARDPSLIANETLRAQMGSMERLFQDFDASSMSHRAQGLAMWLKGKTLRRWMDESQAARAAGVVKDKLGRVVDKSMELNGLFDNFYRIMAYEYGEARMLKRMGVNPETARQAGLELSRKVMMDWAGMTPFERSIMKSIVPFYGFMRHSIGYAMRYPLDHPLRADIIGKLGMAEAEDVEDLMGTRFLGALFLGQPDEMGRITAVNLDPMNPFRDVAHMMTLQGFLGATNPLIATMLESVGLDSGQAELYPTLRYDPETGRLTTVNSNPVQALVENTIPQTQIVTGLLGLNSDLRRRFKEDPASAVRTMATSAGIPMLWRQYNEPQEMFKAEMARQKAQADVFKQAVTSGNWATAQRYPGLADKLQGLREMDPETAATYAQPNAGELARQIIERGIPSGGSGTGGI